MRTSFERAIKKAETKGRTDELAALYIERAHWDLISGDAMTGAENLRKAIMIASKCDQKEIHAAARLELADLAQAGGDLTTACEHWQLARALFHKLDQKSKIAETDARMQRNGCPTDWVLNDF